MNRNLSITLLALATLLGTSNAGRYPTAGTQTFTFADNTRVFDPTPPIDDTGVISSSGPTSFVSVLGNVMKLTPTTGATTGAFKVGDLDPGKAIQSFDATFMIKMKTSSSTAIPGGGWSLNFGAIPTGDGSGTLGYTMPFGISIGFDTFRNDPSDTPSIQVFCNNTLIGNFIAHGLTGSPAVTAGSFTLKNPVSGGTTGLINVTTATAASVQSSMRTVSGWSTVTVTGPTGGPWTVNRGVTGQYADPALNSTLSLAPGGSTVTITNTQDGNATTNEQWVIAKQGPGFTFDDTFRPVVIHWDYSGLDMSYNGQVIFTNLATPGFVPAVGNRFAISAQTESSGGNETWIDDLVYSTTPVSPAETGGPVISEFMAENANTLEDEDLDSPDWIEIYNGQNTAVNLAGWQLTNGVATWTFPSVSVPAYGYLVVYASGKDRTTNLALLHTNFTLQKEGGTVSLLPPVGAAVSTYTYGNQFEDISYGQKYQFGQTGYIARATPGLPTLYSDSIAPNGPAEDVIFTDALGLPKAGGLISGATQLYVAAPVAAGSVVRYTLDNSDPNEGSPVYSGPIQISASTNIRARIYTPDRLPGAISSRTYLLLDSTLTNYNGSNQPFKSHLPIIVLDSFGVAVDGVTDQAQARPHRYTYSVVIDKDATGYADITSATYDFQGRSGTHVRGDSSGGFAQKSYAWETWDNSGNDKDVSILGMPAESDWVLYGPYTDKTFFRNFIMYSKMRELYGGVDGHAMRTTMVEVFYNQGPSQPVSYDDYRGVYVLIERIKVGKDRIDIAKLNDLTTDPALITGGYIFRRDRTSSDGNTPLPVGMHAHTPNILNSAQTTYLSNYITAFNNALNGANFTDPVSGYAPYIDRDSFIDNWWFVEIAKQIDGYRLSTYFYKDRGNPRIVAAPIWDYNLSLGNADYLAGDQPTGWYWNQTDSYWWARLRQDPNYETRNWDRYWEMRRGIWGTASINAYIDQLASIALNGSTTPVTNSMTLPAGQPSTMENSVMRHYRKYPILGVYVWPNASGVASRIYYNSNGNSTTGEIDWMKNWLAQRMLWLDDQYTSGGVIYRPPNFSNYGGNIPSGTQLTITPYTGTPPAGFTYAPLGTIYYTTDGSDPRPSTTGGGPTAATLLDAGAACKWLVPSAGNGGATLTAGAGAEQWTNYTDPPNIANWTSGVTGVGYDTGDGNYNSLIGAGSNTGTQMQGINATCYVRVVFNIPDAAALANIGTLTFGAKYDDGYRAYINGVYVCGGNDTDASLTNSPSTAISSAVRDEGAAVVFEDRDISALGIPALRVGTNVLAIHCLNGADSTSSDLIMVPRLTYLPPGVGGGGGNGIAYSAPITLTTSTTIKARLLYNGFWSPVTTGEYVVNAVPASASNLVITEVMYNPSPATVAESNAGFGDNDFEYIELQNISAGNIDLSGCNFTTGVTFDFDVASPATLTLPPGGRIVVVANDAGFSTRYGAIPGLRKAGQFSGSLSNSGELITLTGANGAIIAEFTYGTGEPWPAAAGGDGYSLVLNNPAAGAAYGSASSWRSSAAHGGSPGGDNAAAFTGLPNGDSDLDGLTDFLEYGIGSDMHDPNSVNRPTLTIESHTVSGIPAQYLTFRFRRNLAADGVNFTPQLCSVLGQWDAAAIPVTYVSSVNNGDGTATVTYRGSAPHNPAGGSVFARLRVSP